MNDKNPSEKRKLLEKRVLIASHNSGKIVEIKELFSNFNVVNIELISSKELNLSIPKENGLTFKENALIKAKCASIESGLVSISDDSGLCINCLNGKPGVFSADWAGPQRDFGLAMKKIKGLMDLEKKIDSSASMISIICIYWPDGYSEIFKGEAKGNIVFPPRGKLGFGYDPIFLPKIQPNKNKSLTFGEINPEFKNKTSHRNKAFVKFIDNYLL